MAELIKYILTERELKQLTGGAWPDRLVKDYIASAVNEESINSEVGDLTIEISTIQGDIITINGQITSLSARVTTAEGEIATLQFDLTALDAALTSHVGDSSAHGATGDIVGTDDYCSSSVGGTVLLASAQADATASAVTPPAALGAASAAYVQAEQQAQTDAINALENNINTIKADLNALVTVVNNMLATERAAKQRAT